MADRTPPSRPDFSDVESGSSSGAVPEEVARDAPEGRSYTVQKGDSLSRIARELYGDASEWRKIWDANRDQINDPDLIHPGQVLNVP